MALRAPALALLLVSVLAPPPALANETPFNACLERFRAEPTDYESSFCFYEQARPGRRWQQAEALLETLIAEQPENHWPKLVLGHVHWRLAPSKAEATYRAAADGFKGQAAAEGEALARANLFSFLIGRGDSTGAAAEVDRVVELGESSPEPTVRARALILEADLLRHQGQDLETAYALLRQAQPLIFDDGPYRLRRTCLIGLGSVCFRLGRYGEARRHYSRLEALASEAGDDYAQALFKYNQANTLLAEMFDLPVAGGRERLTAMYRNALDAAQRAGHRSAEIQSHRILGELLSRDPDSRDTARSHLDRCVELAEKSKNHRRLTACLRALGGHSARWGDHVAASDFLDRSLQLARQAQDPVGEAKALDRRMRAAWTDALRSHMLREVLDAQKALESLRGQQLSTGGRAGFFAVWSDLYYWAVGRLLQSGSRENLRLAFDLAERLRARVLLEALAESSAGSSAKGDATAELVRIQRRLLDPGLNQIERRRLLRDLERVELRESSAGASDPAIVLQGDFADLGEVEGTLRENEALLSFQIAPWQDIYGDFGGGSWLLVSTRAGTRVYELPDRTTLQPAARLFVGLFANRDGSERPAASRLYEYLLAEALADLAPSVDTLVIVPDDDLHRLPFSALRDGDGKPLVQGYRISRVPSATLWLRWRQADTPQHPSAVLAFADPLPIHAEGGEKASRRDWTLADGGRLGPLPYARDEGRNAVRRLGGRLLIGADAGERVLKTTELTPFGVVHFAAHAVIDTDHAQRSAVVLAPGDESEDGLLQPRDIAGLDLDGRIVVLSACQSASGTVLRGEGVLSLARAFFQAGATTVVGSLWRLRDDEAAAFFDRFYHHLAAGETVSSAMATAQNDLIRAGKPAAAWAGLTVLGDGTAVIARPRPATPWWALALLAVSTAVALALGVLGLRHLSR